MPQETHVFRTWLLVDGVCREQQGPNGSDLVSGFNLLMDWEMKCEGWSLLGGSRSQGILERFLLSLVPTELCFQLYEGEQISSAISSIHGGFDLT